MDSSFFFISDDLDTGSSSSNTSKQLLLESCNFCMKRLDNKEDIFMYRGDTPFCSEECRLDQIEIDKAMERMKKRQRSSSSWKKRISSSTIKKGEEAADRATSSVVAN